MITALKHHIRTLTQFSLLSSVLTLAIILFYFTLSGQPGDILAASYSVSILAYYILLVLLLSLFMLPLAFIPRLCYLVILPKGLLDFLLIGNFFVFRLYKFHIDMMFVNMAIHDAKGIGISSLSMSIAAGALLLFLLFNVFIYKKVKEKPCRHTGKGVAAVLLLVIFGQCVNAWAVYFNQHQITRFTPYFPYYMPATATKRIDKLKQVLPAIIPDIIEDSSGEAALRSNGDQGGLFHYPKNPLSFAQQTQPNVLLFVLESWRFDALTQEVMPNIHHFSETNTQFQQHFSGGNVTISGLFSLMYGLHPTYMKAAQSNPFEYQTLLTRSLVDQGYSVAAYTSSNLTRFTMKQMFFGNIAEKDFNMFVKDDVNSNDIASVNAFKQDLQANPPQQPWFKLMFLSSSHHSYVYPDEYKKSLPIPNNAEGFIFDQNADAQPYVNDYHNSLRFMDALFAEVYAAVKAHDDGNTIVIVTSDHGEEFNDNGAGHWGHGRNFTRVQTHVPLIIQLPGQSQAQSITKRSAHVDVVPTILKQVGLINPVTDFSSGYDLYNLPEQRNIIATSYKDKAYILGNTVYSTGLFTDSYALDDYNEKTESFDFKGLQSAKKEERDFYQ